MTALLVDRHKRGRLRHRGGLTRQEFNDYVNSRPNIFRLENRSENRSHRNEMPGKDDIERIVRDMKNFERGK